MISRVLRIRQAVRKRWNRWLKLRSYPRDFRLLFWQSALLLPAIALGLRGLGLQRVQALLARSSRKYAAQLPIGNLTALPPSVELTRSGVYYAARLHRGRFTCLPQSLALWWLLRRRGFAPDFRLGARQVEGQFQAHAWVECAGYNLDLASLALPSESSFIAFVPPVPRSR